jgi:hypothetical protein
VNLYFSNYFRIRERRNTNGVEFKADTLLPEAAYMDGNIRNQKPEVENEGGRQIERVNISDN